MITGYNTDVSHNERAFHVQTEDKGTSNPYIESLVYVGGQVLAAKRTEYAWVLEEGKGKDAIVQIMDEQHQSMIQAIHSGQYDQKVIELLGNNKASGNSGGVKSGVIERAAARVTHQPAGAERTLDEVILEYLTAEAEQEHLLLSLDGQTDLGPGLAGTATLMACSSKTGNPVPAAEVVVKMISTVAEPKILASGTTDQSGRLSLDLSIPEVGQGSSALIMTASSTLGRAELKYLL